MIKKNIEKKNIICKKCGDKIHNCIKKRECNIHTISIKKNGQIYCKDCYDDFNPKAKCPFAHCNTNFPQSSEICR